MKLSRLCAALLPSQPGAGGRSSSPSPGLSQHGSWGGGSHARADPANTHTPSFPAGGSGIHRQLGKEPAFGAEYRAKVRAPGVAGPGEGSLGLCWGRIAAGLGAGSTGGISAPREAANTWYL